VSELKNGFYILRYHVNEHHSSSQWFVKK
jgi:hypothetical protein